MSIKIRFKKLKNGAYSLYLDVYHHGTRSYEFLDIHLHKNDPLRKEKIQLAERIRSTREVEIHQADQGILPDFKKKIEFTAYFESFAQNYTGKDVRLVKYALSKFKQMTKNEKIPIASLSGKICSDFANYLKSPQGGLHGETPYNYWMKFRRVLRQAVSEGIIAENPAQNIIVRRKTNQIKKNVLSTEEIRMLASTDCDDPEVKRVFLFSCYTGLGAAEIRNLKCRNIQDGRLIILRQKSKEQVIIDLHSFALFNLGQLDKLEEYDSIFTLPTDTTIHKHLKNWVASAGIKKKISYYCARHTFATQLLLNGANLKTVADCLGHSTTNHTVKYLNFVDGLKSAAIKNLPNI